jgi:phage nucleotide-binding protein
VSDVLTPTRLGGLSVVKASELSNKINMLIYGEPGVGKTRIIGSCDALPEMRKVCILDIDGGALTVRDTFPNVDVIRITSYKELQGVYDDLKAGGHSYQTIGIDTITEVQKYNMTDVMRNLVAKDPNRNEYVPDRREWGISSEMVRRMIHAFKDLPYNTIFTAHVKDDEDQSTGVTIKRPDLPGKLARQIPGWFDLVVYMYEREVNVRDREGAVVGKEVKRVWLTKNGGRTIVKDRTDKLPRNYIIEPNKPTMVDVHKILNGPRQGTLTAPTSKENN